MCIPAPTCAHAQCSESRASLARNHTQHHPHTMCTHNRRLGVIWDSIAICGSAGPAFWGHLRALLGGCGRAPTQRTSGVIEPRCPRTRVARASTPLPLTRVACQPVMVVQPVLSRAQHHTPHCTVMHTPLSHTLPSACSPAARHTTRTHIHALQCKLQTHQQDMSGLVCCGRVVLWPAGRAARCPRARGHVHISSKKRC